MKIKKTLNSLFAEHRGKVSDKWSIYLAEYDRLFLAYRNRPVRLLEIGIQNGGSLEIWNKFFSKAEKIVGCDINPDCTKLKFDNPKIAVIIANANSDEAQQQILLQSPNFDLIIDDGSHQSGDIVRSFARYFPMLNDGGLYIGEDLHCSYWEDFEGGIYQPYSSIAFFKRLADVINHEHWGIDKTRCDLLHNFNIKYNVKLDEITLSHIHAIEFINSICVIRKAKASDNILGNRLISGENALVWEGALQLHGSSSALHNQTTNKWSTSDIVVEEELMIRINEVSNLNQHIHERENEIRNLNQSNLDVNAKITDLIKILLKQDHNFFKQLFNGHWYKNTYPDINNHEINPYEHYAKYGVYEGRHPSADSINFVRDALLDNLQQFNNQLQSIQHQHKQQKTEQDNVHAEREQAYVQQLTQARQKLENCLIELDFIRSTYVWRIRTFVRKIIMLPDSVAQIILSQPYRQSQITTDLIQ